jgi:pyruvate ferredoxin oxidoreductase alpha subunit
VVILEKCLAVGIGGIVSDGVRKALAGIAIHTHTVIAGLGGRAITRDSLMAMIERGAQGALPTLEFLDLQWDVVKRELEREKLQRRAGPAAAHILRDVGAVGVRIG